MFSTLLESRRARQRNVGSTFVSTVFHVAMIVGAVYATARATEPEEAPEDAVTYTAVRPKDPPPPPERTDPAPRELNKVVEVKGFQTLKAPIDIPRVIPDIDYSAPLTNVADFIPVGEKGGRANGRDTNTTAVGGTFHIFEVGKVARALPGNPDPAYPTILRQTRQGGRVLVSFVIDSTGVADMTTLKVVESSNPLLSEEVRKVLPKYRFAPAEIDGRKVRMHARMPFEFTLKGG